MVKASKGPRRRTRAKLRKKVRDKGKIKIRRYLQKFKKGEKVVIKPEHSVQKGLPGKRFWGKSGDVVESRGRAYVVEVKDGNKHKRVIVSKVHLKRL